MTSLVIPGCKCREERQAPSQIWRCLSLDLLQRPRKTTLPSNVLPGGMSRSPKTQPVFMKTDGVTGKIVGGKGFQA